MPYSAEWVGGMFMKITVSGYLDMPNYFPKLDGACLYGHSMARECVLRVIPDHQRHDFLVVGELVIVGGFQVQEKKH